MPSHISPCVTQCHLYWKFVLIMVLWEFTTTPTLPPSQPTKMKRIFRDCTYNNCYSSPGRTFCVLLTWQPEKFCKPTLQAVLPLTVNLALVIWWLQCLPRWCSDVLPMLSDSCLLGKIITLKKSFLPTIHLSFLSRCFGDPFLSWVSKSLTLKLFCDEAIVPYIIPFLFP